jgi:hypothetical protein
MNKSKRRLMKIMVKLEDLLQTVKEKNASEVILGGAEFLYLAIDLRG